MIPNITRGSRMQGLVRYLAGSGRHNEHVDQHVVAGDDWSELSFTGVELDASAVSELGSYLDNASRRFGERMRGGNVWHCSLAISREDGVLSDTEWQAIAHEFVERMGFGDEDGTKAPCRWVAIRHGLSGEKGDGNDHIHIAVNQIRTDGTKAWVWHDYEKAQRVCRQLERDHGLEELGNDKTRCATRGWQRGEREAQARHRARAKLESESPEISWGSLPVQERRRLIAEQMRADQPRHDLASRIRAAAETSRDEASFIRRLRGQGVLIRPRFAEGTHDVVTGYSVAEKPIYGETPAWYGGGTLARDLRLPRLREVWGDATLQASQEATDEWVAAFKGRRVAHPQAGEVPPTPQRVADDIARMNRALSSIDPNDRDTWSQVARSTAGAFASWSRAVEPTPGPIAEAARQISRSAQTYRPPRQRSHVPKTVMMHAALALSTLQSNGNPVMAQAIMYRQLFSTVLAIQQAMRARGDAYHARVTKDALLGELSVIANGLPSPGQTSQPQARQQVEPHAPSTGTGKGTLTEEQLQDLVRITHPETSMAAGALSGIRTSPRSQQPGIGREQSHGR
ncbi:MULTISPECIES: relaxase/mobilization nuclease domain-containing protein [Bifidobacterium]|jgi:hypothetical protein|uniref:Relaxases/mobilization protein n=2 Tax=Bifidobacterium TaxID=1678 RepID=A0A087CL64_9BIFI|nr:relaxase/mobilization nuclease domain-containing protein [Bifidobacterium psychraerophilum]KFI84014.1 relaxases/mobilization protein [Bifidobacterium psychraerophilum]PKA94220.1 relaxase/mobilization nuclease-like protein [Bifidobacterium psychraerophilum DSM 22366]